MASAPDEIKTISDIMKVTDKQWMSGQTGVETGSTELMKRYIIGKCRPFEPDAWQETVVSGFNILERNHWIPCATLIMGLPGETEKDVDMTLELVKKIYGYRSLMVPLFFVATGELNNGEIVHIGPDDQGPNATIPELLGAQSQMGSTNNQ